MLTFHDRLKIYAYTQATDMRKGINGLSGLIREQLDFDPADGSLFLFVNRNRDRMKTDQPIRIDRRRKDRPAGGRWEKLDPPTCGRSQRSPHG